VDFDHRQSRIKLWQRDYQIKSQIRLNGGGISHKTIVSGFEGYSTIAQIRRQKKFPDHFRLVARLTDIMPHNVLELIVRKCTGCQKE
jgi:hypothetical protein